MASSQLNVNQVNDILPQFFVLILLLYGFLAIKLWGIKATNMLRGWAKWQEHEVLLSLVTSCNYIFSEFNVCLTLLQLLLVSQKTTTVGTAGWVGLLQYNKFVSTFFHSGNYTQCLLSIQKGYPSHLSSSRKRTHSPPRETTLIWVFAEKGKITILNIYFRNNGNLCSKLFGLSNVFLILPSSRLYTIYKGAITISSFLTINTWIKYWWCYNNSCLYTCFSAVFFL